MTTDNPTDITIYYRSYYRLCNRHYLKWYTTNTRSIEWHVITSFCHVITSFCHRQGQFHDVPRDTSVDFTTNITTHITTYFLPVLMQGNPMAPAEYLRVGSFVISTFDLFPPSLLFVQGNPMAPEEQPRVGSFEISFVDAERGTSQLLFSKIQQGKWPARMDTILRRYL